VALPSKTPPEQRVGQPSTDTIAKRRIPVYTAIRKRYMIYFLGSQGVDGASLVECGDIMMRSAWTEVPQRTPGQLAKHVKNSYFAKRYWIFQQIYGYF